jgi:hypothetical protein
MRDGAWVCSQLSLRSAAYYSVTPSPRPDVYIYADVL